MRASHVRWLLAIACLFTTTSAFAASRFQFTCPGTRYGSTDIGTEFEVIAPIKAVAGDMTVDITFELRLPDTWGAQYCQSSTGICYFEDNSITLEAGVQDTLKVTFFTGWDAPGMGWINLTIRSADDPLDVEHCTFTCYSGLPVPNGIRYDFTCLDNTRWVQTGDQVDFYSPMRLAGSRTDSLIVRPWLNLPMGWGGEFCHRSTGVCYFDEAVLPLVLGETDTLEVHFFPNSPGAGSIDIEVHSKANPSLTTWCHYQVFRGDYTTGTPDALASSSSGAVRVVPNPFTSGTEIELRSPAAGEARIEIFRADGGLVRTLPVTLLSSGPSRHRWDGRDDAGHEVAAGIYLYRVKTSAGISRGMLVRAR